MTTGNGVGHWSNADVDWHRWPVSTYLAENYRNYHVSDDAVIAHHSAFYRDLAPQSLSRTVEIGTGPNLYPLLLASGAARHIDAIDRSRAGLDYLRHQLSHGPDVLWDPYWQRCRALNTALPETMDLALGRVHVREGDAFELAGSGYSLASMHFVAESVTEDADEFRQFCTAFVGTVEHGGYLLAAFMENMGRYQFSDGSQWPGIPVDPDVVERVFATLTEELQISRVDTDPDLPDYGYTGMVLLRARRR
ncbi:MAG TPA: hypothetical protein VGE11_14425 [Pseudonocardia sp.]